MDGAQYENSVYMEVRGDFDWFDVQETRRLHREASRLGVELPEYNSANMYGQVEWDIDESQPHYFTRVGFKVARAALKEARKERLQLIQPVSQWQLGLLEH